MKENLTDNIGNEFHEGLERTAKYDTTRNRMDVEGLSEGVLDETPPIGLNLRLLSEMAVTRLLHETMRGRDVVASILGLSSLEGVSDFQQFISESLGANPIAINVVEIAESMIERVDNLNLPNVRSHLKDARETGLKDASQDIVIRDHLGNCCPPNIDRVIGKETARILKPGGIAIVNITTSENLHLSEGREIIPFDPRDKRLGPLREDIYDLTQLKEEVDPNADNLRGALVEIEPNGSFVIFGEDEHGHGEWFRTLDNHQESWQIDGFEVVEMQSRQGDDSHEPPLRCKRQIAVLKKI